MTPPTISNVKPPGQEQKSWKKINEERKALKRERRQQKWIKELENAEKLKELAKASEAAAAENVKKMNPSTISIAVPGSILENAQSPELRSYLAGQVARAASIFRVNEIIVFDDIGLATARDTKVVFENEDVAEEGEEAKTRTVRNSSLQLARILQYLECPQYLRKFFFPLHKDLKYCGILNPLDTPHHLRQQSVFLYREGIVTERQAKEGRCFVNVGLLNDVLVDKAITPGVRVTVKLSNLNESKKMRGVVVSPDEPRRETGVYWGYNVRIAHSLAEIFTKSPYSGGYDCTIGTSDRGSDIHEIPSSSCSYNHLLIVFGGLAGLEAALTNDEQLNVDDPAVLFDHYLNVLPKQGSRTIRTEEALLIALSALQEKLSPLIRDIEDTKYKNVLPRSEDTGESLMNNNKLEELTKNNNKTFLKLQRDGEKEEIENTNNFFNPFKKGNPMGQPAETSFDRFLKKQKNEDDGCNDRNRYEGRPKTNNFDRKDKKRRNFLESNKIENEMFTNKEFNQVIEPRNKKSKQQNEREITNVGMDDLEIVPTDNKEAPKLKKTKPDSDDLSRFD